MNTKIALGVLILILLGGGAGAYAYFSPQFQNAHVDTAPIASSSIPQSATHTNHTPTPVVAHAEPQSAPQADTTTSEAVHTSAVVPSTKMSTTGSQDATVSDETKVQVYAAMDRALVIFTSGDAEKIRAYILPVTFDPDVKKAITSSSDSDIVRASKVMANVIPEIESYAKAGKAEWSTTSEGYLKISIQPDPQSAEMLYVGNINGQWRLVSPAGD